MSIQIEIINLTGIEVRAAFYYEVLPNQYLPASEDQSREPEGTRLSEQEIQDLKDGRLFEKIRIIRIEGMRVNQIQAKLVSEYNSGRQDVMAEYSKFYMGAGLAYDGSGWS